MDLTMLILQAGPLVTFSSRTSQLACPTPVFTGMNRAFRPLAQCLPLFAGTSLIPRTKTPQRPREDNEWYGAICSSVV